MSIRRCVEGIKKFLWKKNYDFDRPDPSLFNFHPQIMLVLAAQGIFYKNRDSLLRFIWPSLCMSVTFTGVGFQIMFIFHGLEVDIFFAIECFCYLVILGVTPLVYYGVLANKNEILNMLDDINADFQYVCSLGSKHRKQFLDRQLLIWMLCIAWMTFSIVTAILFILYPVILLMYQTLFVTADENTIRPLVFPMWLPKDDPYRTPNYEVFMFLHMSFSIIYVQGFCGYLYLLFHYLIHNLTMMEMIILDLEAIFEDLDPSVVSLPEHNPSRMEVKLILQKRVGRIVTWHLAVLKAVSAVSSVFGPPLVYQVMFSAMVLCLISYQLARALDNGGFNILFALLDIGGCIQLWVPCYLGTLLRNKGFAVGDSCFYCGWNENPLGQLIRQDVLIIIYRAQIPIYIKFTGLPNIQLETFSSVMSTAYSYFNMLRQYSS